MLKIRLLKSGSVVETVDEKWTIDIAETCQAREGCSLRLMEEKSRRIAPAGLWGAAG